MNLRNLIRPAVGLVVMAGWLTGPANAQARLTATKTTSGATKTAAATASTANPALTKAVAEAPLRFHNMAEWRNSPAYAKRKAAYDKYTPNTYTDSIKFKDDHSVLKFTINKKSNGVDGIQKQLVGKPKTTKSSAYSCTTQQINLTANSSSFMDNDYTGSTSNIFPGACYTYANLTNGTWKQAVGSRYPMQLSTDNEQITGMSYVNVNAPDQATLQNGVTQLFQRMPNITGNESFSYQVEEGETSAAYNLNIGAGASGYGISISNVYSTANENTHVHMTIDAIKTMFTISTAIPDSGFFRDASTESTPYLSFISKVNYGVRVLANADLAFASEDEADQFRASYSGFGASADLSVDYGSVSSSVQAAINCYVVGGPGGTTVAYSLKDLRQQIKSIFATATYKEARPVQYEVCTFGGDQINTYSASDNFNVRKCQPADGGSPEIDNIVLTVQQGGDGKEPKTGYRIDVDPGMASGNENPMFTVFTCNTINQPYPGNSSETIILRPSPAYKGPIDLAAFQKSGGHIHIFPICYPVNSTPGIGYDNWDIVSVTMTINLRPTADNPNPTPPGPKGGSGVNWALPSPNMLVLSSQSENQVDLYFDSSFTAKGTSN